MDHMNGKQFREMLESGCNNLNNHKKEVDALNVFPVPDGDTGTNMSLTFSNGVTEVRKAGSEALPIVAKTLSRGLLMGARGNSGVITSQIFRGFYQAVGDQTELDAASFSAAMKNGSKMAYKAVMRPVEGTILTVVRESCDAADQYVQEHPESTMKDYMDALCEAADASLSKTPDLLPILKEAKVVDSGGCGLLRIFEGFRAYLHGTPVSESEAGVAVERQAEENGYQVEFILKLSEHGANKFRESRFRDSLRGLGDHATVMIREDTVKVRVNTLKPGDALNYGQRYGEFEKLQISPLSQTLPESILEEKTNPKDLAEYGIITVCAGEGLEKLFREYRADAIVSGGQTMNPSTEDFVQAIKSVQARHIFILPNNSNIIMAAKQAREVTEDKDIIVLETKSIPQGLSACIVFNPQESCENNTAAMMEAIRGVRTGQITYAIKDTSVDGTEIHEGDYMGIFDKDIVLTSRNMLDAAKQLIDRMVDENSEIVTLIQGKDASDADTEELQKYIEASHEVDVDVEKGGQPVYSFIIGVE